MNARQVAEVCAVYDLGNPLGEPESVAGGLIHQVWHLRTDRGEFAIKVIGPARLRRPDARQVFRQTERIARTMARAGVPAVVALKGARPSAGGGTQYGYVQELSDATVIVYPWVEGETLSTSVAGPERGARIGVILGRIHARRLILRESVPLAWQVEAAREDEWVLLARRGAARGLPWADELRDLVPQLAIWGGRARQAVVGLYRTQVVSHRDLDPPNVIWRDAETPVVADWETAGMINPTLELADTALNWSGIRAGEPDAATFAAVVAGYFYAGGIAADEPREALYGAVGQWLTWLRHVARQSLGEGGASGEEREVGTRETLLTLSALRTLAANLDLCASWMASRLP